MAKVTSKYQVTIPKALADELRIKPGDDIDWETAGDSIRITPARRSGSREDVVASRIRMFDEATSRQRKRQSAGPTRKRATSRGWTREDLYDRGRTR
ncbi:MAG TPA: AbrB/MazE/SpoVT family DNA-binding domain-containing protein [Thermoanaerobaculia bacterium]|nr:AbrB/MazE/SpoVT family DNA-binding domain-containing protein [Thermoanaerobaculia bacterium]